MRRVGGYSKKVQKQSKIRSTPEKEPDLKCSCGAEIYEFERVEHEDQDHIVNTKRDDRMLASLERDVYNAGEMDL